MWDLRPGQENNGGGECQLPRCLLARVSVCDPQQVMDTDQQVADTRTRGSLRLDLWATFNTEGEAGHKYHPGLMRNITTCCLCGLGSLSGEMLTSFPTFWSRSTLSDSHSESNRINKWLYVYLWCSYDKLGGQRSEDHNLLLDICDQGGRTQRGLAAPGSGITFGDQSSKWVPGPPPPLLNFNCQK